MVIRLLCGLLLTTVGAQALAAETPDRPLRVTPLTVAPVVLPTPEVPVVALSGADERRDAKPASRASKNVGQKVVKKRLAKPVAKSAKKTARKTTHKPTRKSARKPVTR